ncbi:hypothetical protein ACR3AM_005422 [Bacillus thuringiensis]
MKKAIIKNPFSVVQWHGEDYPFYHEDAESNAFEKGDDVLVLHEANPNPMGRLYVIYSEKTNESAVVAESYIEFIKE